MTGCGDSVIVSGEPLLSPRLLLRALIPRPGPGLFTGSPDSLVELPGRRPELFAYGRQALATALRELGSGQILVPAYICDTVVDGVSAAGWRWRYYPLGKGLAPDWGWLERNGDPSDRAMLLVHYFGFPSDVTRAAGYAELRRLVLVEDCAHAFLTAATNPAIGRIGAAAIYSWRKFFPVVNGGALVRSAQVTVRRERRSRIGLTPAVREVAKWTLFKSGSRVALYQFGPAVSDEQHVTADRVGQSESPDLMATRVLAAEVSNLDQIAQKRRANYESLFATMGRIPGLRPLTPPLPEGVVPWCLALAADTRDARDDMLETLLCQGIGAWSWPELPHEVELDVFPRDSDLAARTICLPVHQDLGERHVRRVAAVARGWATHK